MSTYTKEQITNLVEGRLDWDTTLRMLSMPKDAARFTQYVAILQQKVSWPDRILLPLGPHLYVVQNAAKRWVVKCGCGHELCDARENWKLYANVYVRDTEEAMTEVYPTLMAPDARWHADRRQDPEDGRRRVGRWPHARSGLRTAASE